MIAVEKTANEIMAASSARHAAANAARTARWVNPDMVLSDLARWRNSRLNHHQRDAILMGRLLDGVEDIADELATTHDQHCACKTCCMVRIMLTTAAAAAEMAGEA